MNFEAVPVVSPRFHVQFNEPTFLLLFLPVLLLVYYAFRSLRDLLLVFASLIFAVWIAKQTILVLVLLLAFNLLVGQFVRGRRSLLMAGIVVDLVALLWCNYANFFHLPPPPLRPPGLSFFTFVAIAYLVDIYRGEAEPLQEAAAVNYFLLFPKFVAGPIVRYRDMLSREHSVERFAFGVRRFIIGLGKKILIATTVGTVADSVFALPAEALRMELAWLGVLAYTIQIYFDFSGYTDMAIGLGAMFGFKLPENFDYPYVATSIREFWRRWHMTLSGWLRDYLYIPLGGSRCATWRVYFNLAFVFLICGFWHGANWTYIVWGALQGVFLLAERATGNKDLPRPVGHVYALLATMISWVFFRSTTLAQAGTFLAAMFGFHHATSIADDARTLLDPFTTIMLVAGILGSFPIIPRLKIREPLATIGYAVLLLVVFVMVAVKSYTPFIYQQF